MTDLTEHGSADKQDRFAGVDIQPITQAEYEAYIQKALEAGYSGDTEANGWTTLKDEDENELSIVYFDDEQRMSVHLAEKNYE